MLINESNLKKICFYPSLEHYYNNEYLDTTIQKLYNEKVAIPKKDLKFINKNIQASHVIKYIESCKSKKSINELFYILFGKKRCRFLPLKYYLIISNLDENFKLEDYKTLAKKVYQEWETKKVGSFHRENSPELKEMQFSQNVLYATHGGGLRYILSFLQGVEKGYAMAVSGQEAIYVSPSKDPFLDINSKVKKFNKRDIYYANKTPYWEHLDIPAVLKFKTEKRHLKQENRGYEACLTSENISNIKEIELIALGITKNLLPEMPLIPIYSKKMKDISSFALRVGDSIKRMQIKSTQSMYPFFMKEHYKMIF
jgi:hypothetical protein